MAQKLDFLNNYSDFPSRVTPRTLLRDVALRALSTLKRGIASPVIRLFFCHYVFDDQIGAFERKILFLKKHGRFVSADDIHEIILKGIPANENIFHISFDDGFRNIITNALPILEKHGVPSTFFVPSAIIGGNHERIKDYCLNTTNYPRVIQMASWQDLKGASARGMTIGSHTGTHARFSSISRDRKNLEYEILGSKLEIEKNLGIPCRHISWPYGGVRDADEESLCFVKNSGYATCFGAFRGRVIPGETSAYNIPRHHFEPHWPDSHFSYFARGGGEHTSTGATPRHVVSAGLMVLNAAPLA